MAFPRAVALSALIHPLPLGCAALLFLNDHAFKGSGFVPTWLTGKLSDVTGLFVFPILAVVGIQFARHWGRFALYRVQRSFEGAQQPSQRNVSLLPALAAMFTGVLFAALKLNVRVNAQMSQWMGPNQMDASDLWALFALVPSVFWMHHRHGQWVRDKVTVSNARRLPRAYSNTMVAFVALACLATSKNDGPPPVIPSNAAAVQSEDGACADLMPVTCHYDVSRVVVQLSGRLSNSRSCGARVSSLGVQTPSLNANVFLKEAPMVELEAEATLIAAWGQPREVDKPWEKARIGVETRGQSYLGPVQKRIELEVICHYGITAQDNLPVQVAQ